MRSHHAAGEVNARGRSWPSRWAVVEGGGRVACKTKQMVFVLAQLLLLLPFPSPLIHYGIPLPLPCIAAAPIPARPSAAVVSVAAAICCWMPSPMPECHNCWVMSMQEEGPWNGAVPAVGPEVLSPVGAIGRGAASGGMLLPLVPGPPFSCGGAASSPDAVGLSSAGAGPAKGWQALGEFVPDSVRALPQHPASPPPFSSPPSRRLSSSSEERKSALLPQLPFRICTSGNGGGKATNLLFAFAAPVLEPDFHLQRKQNRMIGMFELMIGWLMIGWKRVPTL